MFPYPYTTDSCPQYNIFPAYRAPTGAIHPYRSAAAIHLTGNAVFDGDSDAVLMASITHLGNFTINQMKEHLRDRGLPMNLQDGHQPILPVPGVNR